MAELSGGCPLTCDCEVPNPSGNDVHFIPVKIGEPLSSACERATHEGSIPEVVRFANFTLVNGAVAQQRVSMGGICNLASFFKTRAGCYYDTNARLSGATCC